jgi:hypothetical protein
MPIGDFIGTLKNHEDIPELFQKITDNSKRVQYCYFRLHAGEGTGKGTDPAKYYGLRKDESKGLSIFHLNSLITE